MRARNIVTFVTCLAAGAAFFTGSVARANMPASLCVPIAGAFQALYKQQVPDVVGGAFGGELMNDTDGGFTFIDVACPWTGGALSGSNGTTLLKVYGFSNNNTHATTGARECAVFHGGGGGGCTPFVVPTQGNFFTATIPAPTFTFNQNLDGVYIDVALPAPDAQGRDSAVYSYGIN